MVTSRMPSCFSMPDGTACLPSSRLADATAEQDHAENGCNIPCVSHSSVSLSRFEVEDCALLTS